jgi:sulfur-carrier protein
MTSPTVSVVLPPVLAALAGDRKLLQLPVQRTVTVADLLDILGGENPVLNRRIRDETGAVRRYVNLFVDGEDVRALNGTSTEIRPGQELFIIQSVAGG